MPESKTKQILVTGATGGIGTPLLKYLVQKGYRVLATARIHDRLRLLTQSVREEFPNQLNRIQFCETDFSDPPSFKRLIPYVESGLDGLVLMPPKLGPASDCLPSDQYWNDAFHESFIGPLALIREMIPFLKKRTPSKVVILSGITSVQVLSHYATTNAMRAAWVAQAKTLAFAYGPDRIHFNTLSLGGVMTDARVKRFQAEASERSISFEERMEEEIYNVPLRKYATPLEVAQAIEGLLSEMSDHISGMNIVCDGGFTRAY